MSTSSIITSSSSTASTSTRTEDGFEVEKILDKKEHKGVIYYKVKWIGYDEPTWESKDNCIDCDVVIREFESGENLNYEDEDEWEVEAILNKRMEKNKVQYLVKWRGWPGPPSWEYADNCECVNLIAAYENPKLKKMWDFKGINKSLWVKRDQMLAYMKDYIREQGLRGIVNLLKFEIDFPKNEKQLPLKDGLNIGPLCYENHWYLVIIFINHICVTRRILIGDSLNTLIGTNTTVHPVIKRLKKVYPYFPIKPFTMTQMDRSDVCAFYTLAAFERALFLYTSSASFISENLFFGAPRAEVIRRIVKPETDGEVSAGLPIPKAFDHGPMCEFCEVLFESHRSVDEHIRRHHMKKRKKVS